MERGQSPKKRMKPERAFWLTFASLWVLAFIAGAIIVIYVIANYLHDLGLFAMRISG
jgi:hypothetical protein